MGPPSPQGRQTSSLGQRMSPYSTKHHQCGAGWGPAGVVGGAMARTERASAFWDPWRCLGQIASPLGHFAGASPVPPVPNPPLFGTSHVRTWRTQEGPVGRARSNAAGCLPLQNTPMAEQLKGLEPTGAAAPENHHFQTPTLPPGPRPTRHTRTTARHDYPSPGAWIAASQRRGCSSGRAGRMGGQDDGTPVRPVRRGIPREHNGGVL